MPYDISEMCTHNNNKIPRKIRTSDKIYFYTSLMNKAIADIKGSPDIPSIYDWELITKYVLRTYITLCKCYICIR